MKVSQIEVNEGDGGGGGGGWWLRCSGGRLVVAVATIKCSEHLSN